MDDPYKIWSASYQFLAPKVLQEIIGDEVSEQKAVTFTHRMLEYYWSKYDAQNYGISLESLIGFTLFPSHVPHSAMTRQTPLPHHHPNYLVSLARGELTCDEFLAAELPACFCHTIDSLVSARSASKLVEAIVLEPPPFVGRFAECEAIRLLEPIITAHVSKYPSRDPTDLFGIFNGWFEHSFFPPRLKNPVASIDRRYLRSLTTELVECGIRWAAAGSAEAMTYFCQTRNPPETLRDDVAQMEDEKACAFGLNCSFSFVCDFQKYHHMLDREKIAREVFET